MTKRLYNKNFIILLILCNSDKNFSSNFPYNLMQNIIGKILDIVPPIKDKKKDKKIVNEQDLNNTEININNPENNINNENNDVQNIQNKTDIQNGNNQQQINNIQISYSELIEEHYIWVAFLGTLLKHYKRVENNDGNEKLPQINLDEPINTFFKEHNKGKTTLQSLSNFFNNKSLKKNFITEKKKFIDVIGEYSNKFGQNDIFKIILDLKKKLVGDNKKKIALFWMFTVALGRHAAEELSKKAKQLNEDHYSGEDYIKANTLKYIEISFKERANLYKKLENMFLLFYKLARENVENNTFISKICENMKNNICDACFNKSFINLMYRNRNENENGGYIDLVEAIRRV